MNKQTLRELKKSEDLRVRAVAELAIVMDIPFKEAEKIMDKMIEEAKKKINLQVQFEAAIDAEFNC